MKKCINAPMMKPNCGAFRPIRLKGISVSWGFFFDFFDNRPIDSIGEEEIREFLLYLLDSGKSSGTVNIYNIALRFIFGAVLGKRLNYQMISIFLLLDQCKMLLISTRKWHIVEYWGRYTHRVAIPNNRILKIEDGTVTFKWRDYRDSGRWKIMTLAANEFIWVYSTVPDAYLTGRFYKDPSLRISFQPGETEKVKKLQNADWDEPFSKEEALCRIAHPKTHRQKSISMPALRIIRPAQGRSCSAGSIKLQSV